MIDYDYLIKETELKIFELEKDIRYYWSLSDVHYNRYTKTNFNKECIHYKNFLFFENMAENCFTRKYKLNRRLDRLGNLSKFKVRER